MRRDVYKGYLHLGEKIDLDENIICTFYFEPVGSVENAVQAIAAESSIGTWTELCTMKKRIRENLSASVFELNQKNKVCRIAYPLELFEPNNIPQLLSDVAGNIFGMKEVENLRLLDIELPKRYARSFKGPAFGIEGVRKIMNTENRPHLGTIVKPKVGLSPKENAQIAFESWVGGIDFVKDDENLSSQKFSPFEERIARVLEAKDKAEQETGEKKMYAPNITAETHKMLERAEFVKAQGGNCIMVDIVTAGFAALQTVREANTGMVVHAHRAMYASFARSKRHGISMLVLAKLARLAGVDQLHTGAILGKMEAPKKEVLEINEAITSPWHDLKRVLPVASGGLDPTKIPRLIEIAGIDLVINAGGGVHGHPKGSRAGAKAMRQAMEAGLKKIPLQQYARAHEELRIATEKWG